MDLGIKGKNAIVTGGATGLGKQIVLALVNEGVNVSFTYMNEREEPEKLIEEVKKISHVKINAVKTDLSKETDISQFIEKSAAALGDLDILVNNAGIWLSGYVTEIKPKEWDLTMAVNLKAVFLLSQQFVNHCVTHGKGGSILNITSQAAFHGSTTGHAHYAASKAGLIGFSISLAREVAKKGINVNNIAIGIMETNMIKKNLSEHPDYYVNRIPMGRVAQPSEIAQIGLFLVSEKACYMTGATVDVTGGMLMR